MSFVSPTGSWPGVLSGFSLSRSSVDTTTQLYKSYKQLGKDLAGGRPVSVPETTSLWVSRGPDTVKPIPVRTGTFANQYISVPSALPTIETSRPLFGDEVPNSRLMQGLNKSYIALSTSKQPQFLLKLKTESPEIHQAFVEWNLLQSGMPHSRGFKHTHFSLFVNPIADEGGRKGELRKWLGTLKSAYPAQFNFLQNLSCQLNALYESSGRSEDVLNRLIKPLVPWVTEQGAKDLVQTGGELFGDRPTGTPKFVPQNADSVRPPVSGSTRVGGSKAAVSTMSMMDLSPAHSAAVRPHVVGSTLRGGSKAAVSNMLTISVPVESADVSSSVSRRPLLNRGPGLNVVSVDVRVKLAIPTDGHVAVSKLAHQLVDAYEKRLTSISVDVNKIRRDQDALFELAEEWQDLEPNLAATMHRLARHELFDDLNRLNIDIQYGGPEHVQSPSSRKVHNLRELAYRTTLLDPQGAYGQYLAEGDFAVESLNLDPWVSPQSAEPIEIDLESDFGRGLVRVLNFIGESCKATRTPTEWTAVGGRLEQQFVSPECQNRQEVWDAVGSLRELALTNSTESLVSDAFLEGFMTNKALAIWNSQPKPSPIVRRTSGMTPQPEIAAAAATSVSMPLGDQERVIGLAERSLLREVVVALLPLVDDPQNEARTETQWRELGGRVGQKFIEGPTSNNEIFQRVNRLVYFAEYGDEDPDIWGPLLDGIFSVGGVTAKYDQIDLMGSSGRSTPRSVGADAVEDTDRRDPLNSGSVSSVVSTPAASGSRSHGNSLIQPVFLAGDGDDDGPLDEGATLLGVLRYINGSNAEPTEPIDWRAVGQAFRARVDELSSLNSPVSPSANLAIIQMALDDIEHPSQATIDFLDGYADASSSTNLPSQDASFGRIYALEPGLFVSDRTASEPFFELGMNVRDALARYGRQIDGLGSRSSGIEGNDSGEHGETSERHSQLQAAVNELRSGASQSERIRSFFKGFDSDSRNSSTLESFYVGQTAGGTVRQSLFGEDDDLFGLDGEFVPGFENSINSVSPGVGRGVVASSTPFYIGGQLGGSSSSVDFEEAPGEDILPGENPGLSASAMHSRGDRESRFTPLNRVHTEGNILKGYKYTGESDAESDDKSDDSGFADALGSYAAVFRRELSVRNKQEKEMNRSSADGDNEIIVAPLDTSAAKNPSRSSLIPNFGIYDYFAGTKRATENASSDPRIASLADADLGPVSRETLEMTSPGKKPGGSPNLRAYDSQKGIELRSSSSGSGSKHSVGDPDEDL